MRSSCTLIVALLLAVGCAPSNPGIIIEGQAAPNSTCSFMPSEMFQGGGVLDTSSATITARGGIEYIAALQVANQIMNRGNFVYPLMADPNSWRPYEAEVELRDVAMQPLADIGLPARFRVPVSGSIVPSAGGADEPGRAIVFVPVIPAVYGDALADRDATIVVAVRLTGVTAGDSVQQTGEFTFIVDLCPGCLIACELDSDCVPVANSSCLAAGQDGPFQFCSMAAIDACLAAAGP